MFSPQMQKSVASSSSSSHPCTQQQLLFNQESKAPVQTITILCIDGGGVRGVIPAVVLDFLETKLQKLSGREDVRLADFFHVMGGTSTGGLIVAMLTTPDENKHPLFKANDITKFYLENCHKIFPPASNLLARAGKQIKKIFGPKYDGVELRNIIRDNLKQKSLGDALTHVVIPTVDIKTQQATIFSTYQIQTNPSLNALLSDICIGTSAAPTYLPSHKFEHTDSKGNLTEFNLIDGGLVANNPTSIAISEVRNHTARRWPGRSFRFVVLSVGTGTSEVYYDATISSQWGYIGWLKSIFKVMNNAQSNLADYESTRLLGHESENYYLRIQPTLTEDTSSIDDATPENMNNLVKAAEDQLKKPMTRLNTNTGELEQVPHITNEEALERLAEMLYKEYMLQKSITSETSQVNEEEKIDIVISRD